jgi:hypothetical protein
MCSCNNQKTETKSQPKQLNISILLDLSDRIKQPATPSHIERDKEIIKCITEYFKKDMEKRNAYRANGKIKVFFYPVPDNASINDISEKLKIDCSKLGNKQQKEVKQRKEVYDSITELFARNISEIYNHTINKNSWPGCDIWRFFKDDLEDYCIERDTNYRNVLIILTDGYIYHKNTYFRNNNRYSYLLDNINKFNSPTNWMQQINDADFGLIKARDNLNNLEIMVLEISDDKNKTNEDILKYVIEKWFKEMNVARSKIYSTDLPSNTKKRIENFLNY